MSKIPVLEIFCSIQGEGPNVGMRCLFIRTKNCDFACDFCDSRHTWASSETKAIFYTPKELAEDIRSICKDISCNRVVLTGGNPCLHDFRLVIVDLLDEGITFDIETQGSIIPEWLRFVDTVVFSPKAPSSKMPDTYDKIVDYIETNKKMIEMGQVVAIKIPVFTDEDIDFARRYARFVNEFNAKQRHDVKLYLSVGNTDVNTTESIRDRVLADYESLLNKINEDPKDFQNVFILPQIHTLVWGNKQGV